MFAYGFSLDALKIVHSYLSDRWHRTKIDGSYSTWRKILQGMPQGSVNGPKWFNIYLNDLFFLFLNTEVCNIADDTTPYACDADLGVLLHNLESDTASALLWFDLPFEVTLLSAPQRVSLFLLWYNFFFNCSDDPFTMILYVSIMV